ncbi:MAG: ComEC/Rec2 family competence protein [Bacillota bacterium]|nr:ComEC/Rec2 family competence protein [Bacillota bacterium]
MRLLRRRWPMAIICILGLIIFLGNAPGIFEGNMIKGKVNENTAQAVSGTKAYDGQADNVKNQSDNSQGTTAASPAASDLKGELKVHFIDVGQADSILVQQGNAAMLVDGGNNEDGPGVKCYLEQQKITQLDYVVGTHAHEDHIGGLDTVINSFKVGKVYFPKQTATTATYKDFVKAVKNKGLSFTAPVVGDTFKLGDATCTIIAPNGTSYEDPNDYSIVIKVTYGNNSFLLTGDAEAKSEAEIVAKGMNISADVLKVGHHGSKSSTSQSFLDKVNPRYAVISVGKGNDYGHPTQETLNRLKNKGVKIYRTDENGTVIAVSNGRDISFKTQPGTY